MNISCVFLVCYSLPAGSDTAQSNIRHNSQLEYAFKIQFGVYLLQRIKCQSDWCTITSKVMSDVLASHYICGRVVNCICGI